MNKILWKLRYHLERLTDWLARKWRHLKQRFHWFDVETYDAIFRLGKNRRLYAVLRREPETYHGP